MLFCPVSHCVLAEMVMIVLLFINWYCKHIHMYLYVCTCLRTDAYVVQNYRCYVLHIRYVRMCLIMSLSGQKWCPRS